MKVFVQTLFCVSILCFISCSQDINRLGEVSPFFPTSHYLEKGIVNKYYFHTKDENGDIATDIEYVAYQLQANNTLQVTSFFPSMEPSSQSVYQFEGSKMKLLERSIFYQGDTLVDQITAPVLIDFGQANATFAYRRSTSEPYKQEVLYEQTQTQVEDSLVEQGIGAKVISQKIIRHYIYSEDTTTYVSNREMYYAVGIGLYGFFRTYEDGVTSRLELVEQIPWEQFQKMADHGVKRIGYIDPQGVLDPESKFSPCDMHERVNDYYNGSLDRAQYTGGKKALWQLMEAHLDPKMLFQESGYLTLRFIINCKGEAGWFTMEEADLDFKPKRFPSETIQHFFEILYQNPSWEPVILREEPSDAYTYITFKLKQGELIEILP